MAEFLVESALLTHGLKSIQDQALLEQWDPEWKIAWLEDGKIRIDDMEAFCTFRKKAETFGRVNYFNFQEAFESKRSGALTASGTMRVCEQKGIPLVVTCGIGGLKEGQDLVHCNDLCALQQSQVSMVATAFKDMFAFSWTAKQAKEAGIFVCVKEAEWEPGYLFLQDKSETFPTAETVQEKTLYLNPMPKDVRLADRRILVDAVAYGKAQEAQGGKFHPAVNARLDEQTKGKTSRLQLASLIQNIRWAAELRRKES